jgi:hypothetical protein
MIGHRIGTVGRADQPNEKDDANDGENAGEEGTIEDCGEFRAWPGEAVSGHGAGTGKGQPRHGERQEPQPPAETECLGEYQYRYADYKEGFEEAAADQVCWAMWR